MSHSKTKQSAVILALAVLTGACGGGANDEGVGNSAPLVVDSKNSWYVGSFALDPTVGNNQLTMDLALPSGEPVVAARVAADAKMGEHGHFSSQLPISIERGDGRYQLLNLVFDMGGSWNVDVSVEGEPGLDVFELPIVVE